MRNRVVQVRFENEECLRRFYRFNGLPGVDEVLEIAEALKREGWSQGQKEKLWE